LQVWMKIVARHGQTWENMSTCLMGTQKIP